MSKTAYPYAAELGAFLYSSGLISAAPTAQQSQLFFDEAINAAVAEWERETGWVPFLSGASQTRTYDPPGPSPGNVQGPVGVFYGVNSIGGSRKLFLNAGVRSVTTVKVGVTLTSAGTALTQNQDFWLRPQNATNYDRPFTYIEFGYPQYGSPQSITVTAPFGFGSTVPDDAWLAIMKKSVMHLVPSLEIVISGGLTQIKLGNDTFTFNPVLFNRQTDLWGKQNAVVQGRYARKVFA